MSWIFVRIVRGRGQDLGPQPFIQFWLALAREKANRLCNPFLRGGDPVANRKSRDRQKPQLTFEHFSRPLMVRTVEGDKK